MSTGLGCGPRVPYSTFGREKSFGRMASRASVWVGVSEFVPDTSVRLSGLCVSQLFTSLCPHGSLLGVSVPFLHG